MIIWLNLLAFGGLEAVFLWPLVLGLYWERANAAGALSAMIVGGVPVCRTGHAESAVSGLSPDRSRAAAEFAGVCGGEQFRSSRPTVPPF